MLAGAARIAIPLLAALSAAPPAYGDIFECTGKGAMPIYQNFPCEFDSLADANLPAGAKTPLAATAASANTGVHANRAAVEVTPQVGMTAKQVRAIWGEPLETNREEFAKGNIETWKYADSRSIRFDVKGRVQRIHW
jgi:hypothetical protein